MCAATIRNSYLMFNKPQWAALIDMNMARGVAAAVSPERLVRYGLEPQSVDASCLLDLQDGHASLMGAVARHGYNMLVAEAFYPVLHMIELVLRNRIHQAFTEHFSTTDWYDEKWLGAAHARMVDEAKTDIALRGCSLDAERIIAELSFGFWCGMFHGRYEQQGGPWPKLVRTVLPRVPKSWATREKVRLRLEATRLIRNRVFHHHPISQYQDLGARHRALMELLGWLSPEARAHVESLCRFREVHQDRLCTATRT